MSKPIIKKIAIEIAGVEVEVTPAQAKELRDALTQLLGSDEPKQTVVRHEWYPRWWYGGTYTIPAGGAWTVTGQSAPLWNHEGSTASYGLQTNTVALQIN